MRTEIKQEAIQNVDGGRLTVWRVSVNGRTVYGSTVEPDERKIRQLVGRFRLSRPRISQG